MKLLIAVDGSSYTRAAARYVVRHRGSFSSPLKVDLVHVRPPIPYPLAASFAGKQAVDGYQRDEGQKALAVAEKILTKAGLAFQSSWCVGEVAAEIERHVRAHDIDLVVTGSHGHGALANLALGSVATKLIASLTVPVLVVTREAASRADREQGNSGGESAQHREPVTSGG
jgi:nucleotide-binding universal stress UspA family protein